MPILVGDDHDRFVRDNGWFESGTTIDPNTVNWQAIGEEDSFSRLLAAVFIGGALHHMEAREVTWDQEAGRFLFKDYPDDQDWLENVADDGFKQTVAIEGRLYMIFMLPGC